MKNQLLTLAPVALALVSVNALGQDELTANWSGSAGVGAVVTDGNSDTSSISGTFNVGRKQGVWTHGAFGSIYQAEQNGVDSADRTEIGYQLDRNFDPVTYGFGRLRYDTDEFGNIDSRLSAIVGVGRTFVDDGRQTFKGEIGLGYTTAEFLSLDPDNDPTTENLDTLEQDDGLVFIGLNYQIALTDSLSFNSDFSTEIADVNTLTVWNNSLNFKVSDRFSVSFGLLTRSNSDIVGALGEKTDTVTTLNLVYGI